MEESVTISLDTYTGMQQKIDSLNHSYATLLRDKRLYEKYLKDNNLHVVRTDDRIEKAPTYMEIANKLNLKQSSAQDIPDTDFVITQTDVQDYKCGPYGIRVMILSDNKQAISEFKKNKIIESKYFQQLNPTSND